MEKKPIEEVIGTYIGTVLALLLQAAIVWFSLNALSPLFHYEYITYWQAIAISLLFNIAVSTISKITQGGK